MCVVCIVDYIITLYREGAQSHFADETVSARSMVVCIFKTAFFERKFTTAEIDKYKCEEI